jgi:hypothetical protein
MRLPTWRFGYCTISAALRALHEHDEGDDARRKEQMIAGSGRSNCALCGRARARLPRARGKAGDDAGEDDQRDAVADAARVICSPSHIRNIVPPTSVMTVGDAEEPAGIDDRRPTPRMPFKADAMP